ncbi:MAG: hypothetical protein [Malazfec virus 3]
MKTTNKATDKVLNKFDTNGKPITEVRNTEVVEEQTVKVQRNVTMKTLKAWIEQTERIAADRELTTELQASDLRLLSKGVKEKFIEAKF